jgi:hypothetical protein
MSLIAVIEEPDVIKKNLKHLGLWEIKRKPQPVDNAPPIDVYPAYDQQPAPSADDYIADPHYPADAYF